MKEREWYKLKIREMTDKISDLHALIDIYAVVKEYFKKIQEKERV